VSSSPPDGELVETAPESIELVFSENVGRPAQVVVIDPSGDSVEAGDVDVLNRTITQPLESALETGTYTVSYEVTSADGHLITGGLTFSVGHETNPVVPPTVGDATSARPFVVAALALALCAALAAAFEATRRIVERQSSP